MKDKSIRKLDKIDTLLLEMVMGFDEESLAQYEGRFVAIQINSPKKIKGTGEDYCNAT